MLIQSSIESGLFVLIETQIKQKVIGKFTGENILEFYLSRVIMTPTAEQLLYLTVKICMYGFCKRQRI